LKWYDFDRGVSHRPRIQYSHSSARHEVKLTLIQTQMTQKQMPREVYAHTVCASKNHSGICTCFAPLAVVGAGAVLRFVSTCRRVEASKSRV